MEHRWSTWDFTRLLLRRCVPQYMYHDLYITQNVLQGVSGMSLHNLPVNTLIARPPVTALCKVSERYIPLHAVLQLSHFD